MAVERDDGTGDTLLVAATERGVGASSGTGRPTVPLRGPALGARPLRDPDSAASGRYEFGELLGQGGMGEVVLAYDEQIGREVAIKRIRSVDPSPDERARFWREARVQGRLEHPAVVPVHDLAVDREGKPFFVMKRLSGTTMQDLLGRLRGGDGGATTPADEDLARRRLLRAFVDVCLAVEFAHSRGIIHRDLKPANVMLGDFGEVYVLDWGIARAVSEPDDSGATPRPSLAELKLDTGETADGTIMGTPAYAAPEQLVGDKVGPAADIYALGCILFEIVASGPLHARRSLASVAVAVDARPSQRRGDAPPELDAVCAAATAIDPAQRQRSARALGNAVQAYLDGDRDVAVRKELAQGHIAAAREAIARGADGEHRRTAMREAGRALALDPTATDAAELVTHLMLSPPATAPAEVEAAIDANDVQTARGQGRLAALSMFGYVAFLPLFAWTGVRQWWVILALVGAAVCSSLQLFVEMRIGRIRPGGIYLNACINAVVLALVTRIVGPFLIAPSLATAMLIGYAAHPRFGRIAVVAAILFTGIAVPWALEVLGVLSPTYTFDHGSLVLSSDVIGFTSAPVQLACVVLLVALLAVVGLLSRAIANKQRVTAHQLELQAWHLRQILPTHKG